VVVVATQISGFCVVEKRRFCGRKSGLYRRRSFDERVRNLGSRPFPTCNIMTRGNSPAYLAGAFLMLLKLKVTFDQLAKFT
jgi:hypothetical protein